MSAKEETVTITRHFTVDMEKYLAARRAESAKARDKKKDSDDLSEAKTLLRNLEKACWRDVSMAIWNSDVLAKFVPKSKAKEDQTAWQRYVDELHALTDPIVEGYEQQLKVYEQVDDSITHLNASGGNMHFDVIRAVDKWMRAMPGQVPTGIQALPLKCDRGEYDNPYFGKDEDLSAIWLLESYYLEGESFCLLKAKEELDQGRCDPAILKSSAPYGMKLAAAALELTMKVLDARIYGSARPLIFSDSFDMFEEISEYDFFYPFVDQWQKCPDKFPSGKYLAMPTVTRVDENKNERNSMKGNEERQKEKEPMDPMEARFNAPTPENIEAFNRAKAAEFPWQYFSDRIRMKLMAQGLLPQSGCIVHLPRYLDSANRVLDEMLRGYESVADPSRKSQLMVPWEERDVETWKQFLCAISASMFDAGVVAACTHGKDASFDPVVEDGGLAIFGDVGVLGLQNKAISFVRHLVGEEGVRVMETVGNDACVNLYWDKRNSEEVFRLTSRMRQAYCRSSCKAAYLAGANFVERIVAALKNSING